MADPSSVANLSLWLAADSLALSDGTAIATWSDDSGNGFDATAAGTAQPTFKTNILNGLPIVRFDGATDKMASSAPASGALQTLTAVVRPTSLSGDDPVRGASGNDGLMFRLRAGKGHIGQQNTTAVGSATTSVSTSVFHIVTVVVSDTANTVNFYFDGAADGAITGTAFALTAGRTTVIGAELVAEFFAGDIAEILVYTQLLSAGDRATVHSYLQDKYAISVADYVAPVVTPLVHRRGPNFRR